MKNSIFLFFIVASFNISGQELNYFNSKVSYVQTYGLEDQSTIDFIQKAAKADYFVVVSFNYFKLNAILNGKWGLGENQEALCDAIVKPLLHNKNIIGNSYANLPAGFPSYHFNHLDSLKFNKLKSDWPDFFELEKREVVYIKDSILAQKVFEDVLHNFELTLLDSLFLYRSMFAVNTDIVPELRAIGITRKILIIENNYGSRDFPELVYNRPNRENNYFFIARKGSKNEMKSILNFKNKIRDFKKLSNDQVFDYELLPNKVYLYRKDSLSKEDLLGFKFIYIDKLDNCMW